MQLRDLLVVMVVCAGGCGGGAGSTLAAPVTGDVAGQMSITIPSLAATAKGRTVRPAFVSASTKSIAVSVNGAKPQTFTVAVPPCTNVLGGLKCIFNVTAPLGNDTFAITLFDAAGATGTILGTGTAKLDVAAGGFGTSVSIEPKVGSLKLAFLKSAITPRVPSTTTLTVSELDPDGNVVTGTYPSPVTLQNSDTTGSIVVSPAQVTASGQTVKVTYDGSTQLYGGASITASAANVPATSTSSSALTVATPCAPSFTPAHLYTAWDSSGLSGTGGPLDNIYAFAPPYTLAPTQLQTVSYPVYMTIDPNGHIFMTQANGAAYPAGTANVVYYSAPYTAAQVAVTPANLDMYGVAVDDKGDLFVSENAPVSGVFESSGPIPRAPATYASPVRIPNSPSLTYGLTFDKYCNLFVDGSTPAGGTYVEILATTGQSGGGYGQIAPVIDANTALKGDGGMAFDAQGDLFIGAGDTIQELKPPYTGTPVTLPFTVPGAYLPTLAFDASGNLFFADYVNNDIDESSPPYTSFTTILSGTLSNALGVAEGP